LTWVSKQPAINHSQHPITIQNSSNHRNVRRTGQNTLATNSHALATTQQHR